MEECESGRIGTIGNRVKGNLPWVQIPPPPPWGLDESRTHKVTKVVTGRSGDLPEALEASASVPGASSAARGDARRVAQDA